MGLLLRYSIYFERDKGEEKSCVCMCQLNNRCSDLFVNEFSSQFADKIIYFRKKNHSFS